VRTDRLLARYDLRLDWTHFPLHPETPPEGQLLSDLFAGREEQIREMQARLERLMEDEGLPFRSREHTYNSRLAQELAEWAEGEGAPGIHDALFRAYFAEGENIGDPEVLARIAGGLGLPEQEAREVLATRRFSPAVDRDWRRSRELGVTGVPTFVAGGYGVVGAQAYEALEQLVRRAGAAPRDG
jgi:predicted DsbA family dithiol-disulfide isomerase